MFGKVVNKMSCLGCGDKGLFQSPCAGNMFGKVRSDRRLVGVQRGSVFQSPCAGNMFGKALIPRHPALNLARGFNPRVRGTCLVRNFLEQGVDRGGGRWFQSPCAGNMFGKVRYEVDPIIIFKREGFNPRVRGTCLVRILLLNAKNTPWPLSPRFNPRVRGTCLVSI